MEASSLKLVLLWKSNTHPRTIVGILKMENYAMLVSMDCWVFRKTLLRNHSRLQWALYISGFHNVLATIPTRNGLCLRKIQCHLTFWLNMVIPQWSFLHIYLPFACKSWFRKQYCKASKNNITLISSALMQVLNIRGAQSTSEYVFDVTISWQARCESRIWAFDIFYF